MYQWIRNCLRFSYHSKRMHKACTGPFSKVKWSRLGESDRRNCRKQYSVKWLTWWRWLRVAKWYRKRRLLVLRCSPCILVIVHGIYILFLTYQLSLEQGWCPVTVPKDVKFVVYPVSKAPRENGSPRVVMSNVAWGAKHQRPGADLSSQSKGYTVAR